MKPNPFASLNHFTVPEIRAITGETPVTELFPTSRERRQSGAPRTELPAPGERLALTKTRTGDVPQSLIHSHWLVTRRESSLLGRRKSTSPGARPRQSRGFLRQAQAAEPSNRPVTPRRAAICRPRRSLDPHAPAAIPRLPRRAAAR